MSHKDSEGDGPWLEDLSALTVCGRLTTLRLRTCNVIDFVTLATLPLEVLDLRWLNEDYVSQCGRVDLSPLASVGTLKRICITRGTFTLASLELLEERIPGLEFRWFHNCRHIFRNVTVDAFGETGRVPEPPREMWARSEYEHSSSDDD